MNGRTMRKIKLPPENVNSSKAEFTGPANWPDLAAAFHVKHRQLDAVAALLAVAECGGAA